jgi:hypothetical protein
MPVLTNVTIAGNTATNSSGRGGGFYSVYSSPLIRNSIIWGNTATSNDGHNIRGYLSGAPDVSYSIVEDSGASGWWSTNLVTDGGNNLSTDPVFTTPVPASSAPTTAGNYRLQSASGPAYNTGNDGDYPNTWALWQSNVGASVGRITNGTDYDTYVKNALQEDRDGRSRFSGGTTGIDRGAYEY